MVCLLFLQMAKNGLKVLGVLAIQGVLLSACSTSPSAFDLALFERSKNEADWDSAYYYAESALKRADAQERIRLKQALASHPEILDAGMASFSVSALTTHAKRFAKYGGQMGYQEGRLVAFCEFAFPRQCETARANVAAVKADIEQTMHARPKTVEVKLASTGTGFFVSERGHILTNQHVIDGCSQIRVALTQGAFDAELLAAHKGDDLALLHTKARPPAVSAFRRSAAALGEDILVAGYPLRGLLGGMNVTTGTVSSTSGLGGDARYLQITAPVQPGNSGGPLLDGAGSVVGVIVAKLDAMAVAKATGDIPQNVNFAIKSAVARSFLSIHDVEFRESTSANDKSRVAVAAEARSHTVLVECWN